MIRVRFSGCRMEAEGHAGFAPEGPDLVCAAFSMLMYTLRANLEALDPPGLEIYMAPGIVRMAFRYNTRAMAMMDFAKRGVKLLEEQYPQCILCENF